MKGEEFWSTVWRVAALAFPVALGELGWMMMTVVDTIMVGSLGPAAIGAISIGNSGFYTFAIFGMGLLLGLDTLVSQAFGAGNREDCHNSLMQGIYLALMMTPVLMLLFAFMPPFFTAAGVVPEVSIPAGKFLLTLSMGTLPLLLYSAQRRYLQGIGHVRPVMVTLISANLVNWFFNWLLIQGHWGFPALGVVGSGLSTCLARVYMAVLMAFFVWWYDRPYGDVLRMLRRRPDWPRIGKLLKIGTPAAFQILLEIGAFSAVGLLAGRLSAAALAAHQIALNCAAVTYMVPLGVSSAAAVTVGQAIGSGRPALARRCGFIAVGLGCAFMICAAVVFIVSPRPILEIYTHDEAVLRMGVSLLVLAAFFQLFDGIQIVSTGALRGLGETRMPMLMNLAGYWALGLPIGYVLCFHYHWQVLGLWWGLTLALVIIAGTLLLAWNHESRKFVNAGSAVLR